MRLTLAAVATVAALSFAMPASASLTVFGGRTYLAMRVVANDPILGTGGGGGVEGELGFGAAPLHHEHNYGFGALGSLNGQTLYEASNTAMLTVDSFSTGGTGSAWRAIATSTAAVVSYLPDQTVYSHFDYEIEFQFMVDTLSPLNIRYENGDFARLFADGAPVFERDFNGQTGGLTVDLTPGINYSLIFAGNSGDTAFVQGLGANSGVDTAIYAFSDGAVPEPATWALMLLGFGGIGVAIRRRVPVRT